MLLHQIGDIARLPQCAPLADHSIWNADINRLTEIEWSIARAQLSVSVGVMAAHECLHAVLAELNKAYLFGDIDEVPALRFRLPRSRMLVSELSAVLHKLSQAEAKLVLLALCEGMDPDTLVELTWSAIGVFTDSFSSKIIRSMPSRLGCPYVFWRDVNGVAGPLFDIKSRVTDAASLSWDELEEAYSGMLVDNSDEAQALTINLFR